MREPVARISLDLDADPELVRLVRLVVSGIASVTPMSLEEVEDCRAAVDELCSTLVEVSRDRATMHLDLRTDGGAVEVSGHVETAAGRTVDEVRHQISEMILDVVTDEHELMVDDGGARFRFTKNVAGHPGSG